MKTIVIYESKVGSTKAYAQDIASKTGADIAPRKGFHYKKLASYDTIVFGGWVLGGTIRGLNKFLEHYDEMKGKNVIVFSVGMSFPTAEGRSLLIEQNLLDMYHVRFYQFQGSFDAKKLKFPYNFLFRSSLSMIANNPSSTPDQKAISNFAKEPLNVYDSAKVSRVVTVINSLALSSPAPKEETK